MGRAPSYDSDAAPGAAPETQRCRGAHRRCSDGRRRRLGVDWAPMSLLSPILRAPRRALGALLLLTLCLTPLAARLRLEGNVVDMLPRSSPAAQSFATFTRSLVGGQELIVLVLCDDPERLLRFADDYVAGLSKLPDAGKLSYRVSSEAISYLRDHLLLLLSDDERGELQRRAAPEALREQVRRLRGLLSAPGGSALGPLLTADPLELVPLISRRLSSGLPVDATSGYFRTADGKALLIKIRPGYDPMDFNRDRRLLDAAGALAQQLGGQVAGAAIPKDLSRPTVAFTGSYAYPPYYRLWLEQDLQRSTTISIVSVLLLFALVFRALRILPWVMLPLLVAGLWTAAAAALLYGRINGVSVAFGTILVAIGIDLPIQLYNRLREELLLSPGDPASAVRRATLSLSGPALVATLGPAAVFLCCGLSDYRGLNELGVLAAVGLCLNCLAMLTIFPCLLICLPLRLWHGPGASAADAARAQRKGLLYGLGRLGAQRPGLLLGGSALLLLVSLPFALRIGFERRLFALEPKQMPPAVAQDEIARRFGDRQRFLAVVLEDPDPERALYRGDLWMRAAERLRAEGKLRGYEALGTLSPSHRTQEGRRAALAQLDLPKVAADLERILGEEGFETAPFSGFLRLLRAPLGELRPADLEKTELEFLVRTHMADRPAEDGKPPRRVVAVYLFAPAEEPGLSKDLLAALQEVARGEAGGQLTGLPLLEEELLRIVEHDARVVTAASLGLVVLLLLGYYRRPRPVLAVLLPLLLAWTLFAAALVLLKTPLNLYNLLCVPLCIGYGIDDHVFLVHRHLQTPPAERDPAAVLRSTGRAIVLTSLATMVGFGGLLVAHFEGLLSLGLTGSLAVLLCLLSACAVLPALLQVLFPGPGPRGANPQGCPVDRAPGPGPGRAAGPCV